MTSQTQTMTEPAATGGDKLAGRTLWIPRMTYAGARMMAAVFRSIGIDARVTPESDEQTLELGGLYTSGEECYPEKVTLGDFLRIVRSPDFDPGATAFLMPTAEGPCRFGQYAPYLKQILGELGYGDVPVVSPTSKNSYDDFTAHAPDFMKRAWWAMVAADILVKKMLKTRPYENTAGDADEVFESSLDALDAVVSDQALTERERFGKILAALVDMRDTFRAVPATYTKDRPLIGVVGEINPGILKNFKISGRVGVFNIDFHKIISIARAQKHSFKPISKFPSVKIDLAILIPKKVLWSSIRDLIYKECGEIVREIELFDIYEGKNIPLDKKSLAFHLIYQSNEKTLKDEDIKGITGKIINILKANFGANLRN